MIRALLFYDDWLTEIEAPVYDADGKLTGETETVPYSGMRTTQYLRDHSGEYASGMEYARLPVPALLPDPPDTLTAAWYDDEHADGLAWARANLDVLLDDEVTLLGEVPNGWPR